MRTEKKIISSRQSLRMSFVLLLLLTFFGVLKPNVLAQQSPLSITTAELPAASVGLNYSITLQAAGGTAPYTWGLPRSEGTPYPSSFSFTSNGVLSGTPAASEVGRYTTRLQVTDSTGAMIVKTFTLSIFPAPVIAENSGGAARGRFAADTSFGTIESSDIGQTYSTTAAIDLSGVQNPAPQAIYKSERWGNPSFTYTLAGLRTTTEPRLTPGVTYLVRLHFAEIYLQNPGERQFNVAINGARVLTNFDIVAEAGAANKAIVKEFTATAQSIRGSNIGGIVISFTRGAIQNPKVSAIEILPATIFAAQRPALPDATDNRSYELGTRFLTKVDGEIRAIRYWKSPSETGSHTGRIWSSTGALLASVEFANETAAGWQEANLSVPLRISRTSFYTVSVNANAHYPITFEELGGLGISNGYLQAATFGGVTSGVFGDAGAYPTNNYRASNYYRDVVFVEAAATPASSPQTIFSAQTPVSDNWTENRSYELGMKFSSDVNGEIRAIRYWKSPSETGAHTGCIWSADGTLLASVEFTNETGFGWQEASLGAPLALTANTVYVVSVNANTHYAVTVSGLVGSVISGNVRTVTDNNGVYGEVGAFPINSYSNSNYFRDVRFAPSPTTSPTTRAAVPNALRAFQTLREQFVPFLSDAD